MFKFSLDEYIKNLWYNIATVLILATSIIVSTIFVTNLIQETKVYRLVKPYLDGNSIIINRVDDIDIDKLTKVKKTLKTNELFCVSDNQIGLSTCVVYSDEVMNIMQPRLLEGQQIEEMEVGENTLAVWISKNSGGLGEGDKIMLNFFSATEERTIKVEAVIAGVVADGQRIFMSDTTISDDMEYEDLYCLYSYRQMGKPIVITTEKEIDKIREELYGQKRKCIVKFDENITEDEWLDNYFKVADMEKEAYGHESIGTFPEMEELYEHMNLSVQSIVMKYIPLTCVVLILITICILGIVLVKNANSVEYYRVLDICGMPPNGAYIITGLEMFVNCIFAMMITGTFVKLQNKYALVGKINCSMDTMQIVVMIVICLTVIIASVLVTQKRPAKFRRS